MNAIGLFDFPVGMPLAARMRPSKLDQVIGQEDIVNKTGPLTAYITGTGQLPSLILYGPPGTGKTSIARILANTADRKIIEISAINASISDLRNAFASSKQEVEAGRAPAIVFIDEIHRFSKVQQESVLKAVEEAAIVLIGATTENPLFALTSALMSRAILLTLRPLTDQALVRILSEALVDERGLGNKFQAKEAVLSTLARLASGDARKALTILETASVVAQTAGRTQIELEDIQSAMPVALTRYDATGDQHYDVISAFIKSVRGSDPDAAIHYLARMLVGGEDPRFIARRLMILAAEDIGLADPAALTLANSAMNVVSQIGMPEGRIPLAEVTIYLALAPKSNSAYNAINKAMSDVEEGFSPEIPLYLRSSSPTKGPEAYIYPHNLDSLISSQSYLLEPRKYFEPKATGFEQGLMERYKRILQIRENSGE